MYIIYHYYYYIMVSLGSAGTSHNIGSIVALLQTGVGRWCSLRSKHKGSPYWDMPVLWRGKEQES